MCGSYLYKHQSLLFTLLLSKLNFNGLRNWLEKKGEGKVANETVCKGAVTVKLEGMRAVQQCLAEW